jgi:hypothetical protein
MRPTFFSTAVLTLALVAPSIATPTHHRQTVRHDHSLNKRFINATQIDNLVDGLTATVKQMITITQSINTVGASAWINLITDMTAFGGQVAGVSQSLLNQPTITDAAESKLISVSVSNYVTTTQTLLQSFLAIDVTKVRGILPTNTFNNAGAPVSTFVTGLFEHLAEIVPAERTSIDTDRRILNSVVLSVMSVLAGL